MSFIARTRIVRIGSGIFDARVLLTTPTVLRTAAVVVETVPEAMALVPAGQRPAQSDWWQYVLEWEVTAHVLPTVRGVIPYAMADRIVPLVVDVDIWQTESARLASQPPIVRNTFIFGFNQRPRDYAATARQTVDDWLIRATFRSWTGDRRDTRIQTSKLAADDPRGLLAHVGIQAMDNQPRTLNGVWRRA